MYEWPLLQLSALLQTKPTIPLTQMAFNCISLIWLLPQRFELWRLELQARDNIEEQYERGLKFFGN